MKCLPADLVLVANAIGVKACLVDTTPCELPPCFGWVGCTFHLNCQLVCFAFANFFNIAMRLDCGTA